MLINTKTNCDLQGITIQIGNKVIDVIPKVKYLGIITVIG